MNKNAVSQWENGNKLIYNKKEPRHGVKIAFEMHPGFCVYNPETLLKLRAAVIIIEEEKPTTMSWA